MPSLNPTLPANFLRLPFVPFLTALLILHPLLLIFLALNKPTLKLSNLLIGIGITSNIRAHRSYMSRLITSITNYLFFAWFICICIWPSWWLLFLIFVALIICCVWIRSIVVVVVVWVWCIWRLVLVAVASGVSWIGVCLSCVLTAES